MRTTVTARACPVSNSPVSKQAPQYFTPRLCRGSCSTRIKAAKAMDANAATTSEPPRVIIFGGGVIGASVCYYLAQLGVTSTVVERLEPACAASGKAGGFLALDWNDSSPPLGALARTSYALHAQLAEQLQADVGYRTVHTLQVSATAQVPTAAGKLSSSSSSSSSSSHAGRGSELLPAWVDGHVTSTSRLGAPSSTAQVHPRKLTHALLDAAQAHGSCVVHGTVEGLQMVQQQEAGGAAGSSQLQGQAVSGVVVDGHVLPADVVVLAMGPWTDVARSWLPGLQAHINGQKYHSIVLRPSEPVTNHCLFTSFRTQKGRQVEPEVYPRSDGSVYVCGEPQSIPVPTTPMDVTVEASLCDNIREVAASLSSQLAQATVETQQACYLPLSSDGSPVIGAVPGAAGVFIATGHSCWGILNGPATGLALAELIVQGKSTSVDIKAFSPSRFVRGTR